jgi:hypothetical protein
LTINGESISSNTDKEVNVNFGSNNNLRINYLDAGKISFTASAEQPETSENEENEENEENSETEKQLLATSNPFVVRPHRFDIEVTDLLAANQLLVYGIDVGDKTPEPRHEGFFTVVKAGTIVVADSDGRYDDELNDFSNIAGNQPEGTRDINDQVVIESTVDGIEKK